MQPIEVMREFFVGLSVFATILTGVFIYFVVKVYRKNRK